MVKIAQDNIVKAVNKAHESVAGANKTEKGNENAFLEILKSSINKTNALQQEASDAVSRLASGEKIDIHNAMIAAQKADVTFRLMMEVRNKIVEAYQEITRMQV